MGCAVPRSLHSRTEAALWHSQLTGAALGAWKMSCRFQLCRLPSGASSVMSLPSWKMELMSPTCHLTGKRGLEDPR